MTGAMKNTQPSYMEGDETADTFRKLALRYVEIGDSEGIKIRPFVSPEMPLFLKADASERRKAISFLQTIVAIHEETLAAGEKTVNSRRLIWRALNKFSLIPGPDVFENFTDEDIVLIYNESQTILFWNIQFFRFVSLTVEHLFFTPWHILTTRSPEIHEKLYQMALDLISGKIQGTFTPPVPAHEVQEVETAECLRTWMELPFGSVLTRNGSFGGVLIVQRMKII